MIILFDLDGTLIDSTEAILESFYYSFDMHNYPHPNDEEIKALIGYPLDIMFARLGVNESEMCSFVTVYKERYRVISTKKTRLLKYAREAIDKASKFATLGIVTTKTGKYSKVLMKHFELMDYFEVLIGREDVENPKPHEEPILKALVELDALGKETWMIGDTKLDLISAQNAKVNSIAVLSGYDDFQTLQKYTKIIFKDALEAVQYLKKRQISHT